MHSLKRFVVVALVLATLPMTAGQALAGTPAVRFHGTFTSVQAEGCVPAWQYGSTGGTWNVVLRGNKEAIATFAIFLDGKMHVAYQAPFPVQSMSADGFVIGPLETGAGFLTVSLDRGVLQYEIPGYDYTAWGGAKCDVVTYYGIAR